MVVNLFETASLEKKGKEKAIITESGSDSESGSSDASTTTSDAESDSENSSSSDSEEEITQEYLDALLQKARKSVAAEVEHNESLEEEEEILTLGDVEQPSLPRLNPGHLPVSYLQLSEGREKATISIRDHDVAAAEKILAQRPIISPPLPPPEFTKAGRLLTKREKKDLRKQTAGPDWFDMPAPAEADLPRLNREVEALRLRNQLDPKRFYRRDEGEGKGMKGLPKYFAIGQIATTESPFGKPSSDNLPRSQRKRTLLDELIDDAEAKRYAKKKFSDLQSVRGTKGRNTLRIKQALRKPKW